MDQLDVDVFVNLIIVLIVVIVVYYLNKAVNSIVNLHGAFILFAVVVYQYSQVYINNKSLPQTRVSGYFHPAFRNVAETFRKNLESGLEHGASFSVHQNGEVLVDLWGGWADINSHRHWDKDTLSLCWSVTKGVSALAIAKLVDSGVIDYNKEVWRYWPEFGTQDKKNITVEMLLSHQAGLLGLDERVAMLDYKHNWTKVEQILASQKPFWPPGRGVGYHAFTWGMYADALVRKVDPRHRSLSQYFEEEIANPLDLDYHIGLPRHMFHRFAPFREYSLLWDRKVKLTEFVPLIMNPLYMPAVTAIDVGEALVRLKNPELLEIGVPSFVGLGSARGLAKLFDYLANDGTVRGQKLFSKATSKLLQQPLTLNLPKKLIIDVPMSRGLFIETNKQGHKNIGHRGYGGSYAYSDTTINVGVAYVTNHLSQYMKDDPRLISLTDAFYSSYNTYVNTKK